MLLGPPVEVESASRNDILVAEGLCRTKGRLARVIETSSGIVLRYRFHVPGIEEGDVLDPARWHCPGYLVGAYHLGVASLPAGWSYLQLWLRFSHEISSISAGKDFAISGLG